MEAARILFPVLPNVTHLDLQGNELVDDEFVRLVTQHCKKIGSLNLSRCSNLTPKSLVLLSKAMPKLENLDISSTRCTTNKTWVGLITYSENLRSLSVANSFLINFEILTYIYPRSATYLDLSCNDSLRYEFLNSIASDRLKMRKPALLTVDIRNCEGITGDEITLLEMNTKANIRYLSNPKLSNYSTVGLRDYIQRLIAL
ncbi:hypothetical protein HDV03_004734 [Kappamyces sp. JEL0829]|nr:hypothetical protein HDV03_004734 [Kappamyces sp. JEL0829]